MYCLMKILVFSDSHGVLRYMEEAIRREWPDQVLHLGDCVPDFEALKDEFPDIPMTGVPGNCDYGAEGPLTRILMLEGQKVFMTHGHRYGVKSGYLRAVYAAREQAADVLLFGHTHRPECFQEGPLWVLNPGAAGTGSYGILYLDPQGAQCRLMTVDGKERHNAAYH